MGDCADEPDPPISVPATASSSSSVYATSPVQCGPIVAPLPTTTQFLGLSLQEAELLVDRFYRLQAPNFPFIKLQNPTARQLAVNKPLLLQAILTVAYFHDYALQQVMVKQLIRHISERVLINGEKSLDILQGILVLVAWFHPHVFTIPQVSNLMHLAQSLTFDLGLDRPVQQCPDFKFKHGAGKPGPPYHRLQATMDEHRAYTGVFFLTSMFSTSFRKMMSMRRSKYLDEVLTILEQAREHDSDLFLVQMVRVQCLVEDAASTETSAAPTQVYVKAFQVDLDRLKKSDPCQHMDNIALRLQYIAAEIVISEMSLNDLQEDGSKPLRPHVDNLCACAKAIKTFIDTFFTIPSSSYLALPFSFYGEFARTFFALIRLATLEVDGWDMASLNVQLNFPELIEEVARRYEASSRVGPDGMELNNESFNKWASRIRLMKQVYESKLIPEGELADEVRDCTRGLWTKQNPNGYDQPMPATQQPTPPDDMLSGDFFNYLDENFWQSFAGDGMDLGFSEMAMT